MYWECEEGWQQRGKQKMIATGCWPQLARRPFDPGRALSAPRPGTCRQRDCEARKENKNSQLTVDETEAPHLWRVAPSLKTGSGPTMKTAIITEEGRRVISRRTKAALAVRKAQGVKLGGFTVGSIRDRDEARLPQRSPSRRSGKS
jgi:hypothetical protein